VVVRFPPWKFGPAFSSPVNSTHALWSRVFQSRLFHPCDLVPRFPVLRFPPPYFFMVPRFPSRVFSVPPEEEKVGYGGKNLRKRKVLSLE